MEHTYEELKKKKVVDLREIAAGIEHEAVKGYTQLNKEHLLKAICTALRIDMHEHHIAHTENKAAIKAQIREMKRKRDDALASRNKAEHKAALKKISHLKHILRKAAV